MHAVLEWGRGIPQQLVSKVFDPFFTVEERDDGHRVGTVVEYDRTETIFRNPSDRRTEDYVTGRFG